MNIQNMKGNARLELRNVDTMELEYEYSQNNAIGYKVYAVAAEQSWSLLGNGTNNSNVQWNNIYISDSLSEVNEFSYAIGEGRTDQTFNIAGTTVPNEYWPRLENDTLNNRYILQYKKRFQPGATDRTITTIGLNYNAAALLLTTPCTQNTTQILDIYYSIYIPYDTSKFGDTTFNQQYFNSNVLLSYLWNGYYAPLYLKGTSTNIRTTSTSAAGNAPYIGSIWNQPYINGRQKSGSNFLPGESLPTVSTTNICQGTKTYTVTMDNNANIGKLISAIGYVPNNVVTDTVSISTYAEASFINIVPILKDTDSPIQSIYLKNPEYPLVYPYLDPSSIGTSTGQISLDGSGWADKEVPLMFKININNDGVNTDVANTSYNFQVRPSFGFTSNNFAQENSQYLWHGVGATDPANQISTNKFHWDYPGRPLNLYTNLVPVYDDKNFVVGDLTGISIVNAFTSNNINFDATTTPAMPTEAVSDYCTGINGTVDVSTLDQGLYIISPDRQTVTQHNEIGIGIDGNICYSVTAKNNGDIWAAFDGGLAKLAHGNSEWEIYNETSDIALVYAGITDGNWAHINKLFINKFSEDDYLLIARKDLNQVIWWSPLDNSPTPINNIYTYFANASPSLDKTVRCLPDNTWFFSGHQANVVRIVDFGETTAKSNITIGNNSGNDTNMYARMVMEPVLFDDEYVMQIIFTMYFNGTISANTSCKHYYNSLGDLVYDANATLPRRDIPYCALCMVTDNILVMNSTNYLRIFNFYEQVDANNSMAWDNYGWNSDTEQWEKNYIGNKPMHTDEQEFYQGLKVSFKDADSNSFFKNNEYWFAYVYNGLHKDNSTSATFGMTMNCRDSYQTSELLDYEVPATGFGELTDQSLNYYTLGGTAIYQYKGGAGIGNNGGSYNTLANSAKSEVIFDGDFRIDFNATHVPYSTNTSYYALLGIYDTTVENPVWTTPGVVYFQFDINGVRVTEGATNVVAYMQRNKGDTYSIVREGTTISYYINDELLYTSTTTFANPMRSMIQFYNEFITTFTNMKCSYEETRPVLTIGSQGNQTGIYDPNYAMIEAWMTNPESYQIAIDGQPATVWTDPVKIPAPGEVLLLQKNGWLVFNPDDAGKTVSASTLVLKKF